jgi:hypothetical protein
MPSLKNSALPGWALPAEKLRWVSLRSLLASIQWGTAVSARVE